MPEPIISPLAVFYLLGVIQALFLALALLTASKGNHQANRYLAAILTLFASALFNEFLDVSLYGLHILKYMFITFPVDMLFGPLLWLYVHSMTGKSNVVMGIRPIWHFLPFAIHSAVIWSEMGKASDPQLFINHPELLLGNQIQAWIMNISFEIAAAAQIGIYLIFCLITLKRYAVAVGDNYSYTEGVGLKWLRRLLMVLLLVFLAFAFRIIVAPFFALIIQGDAILNISVVIVIYTLGFFGVRQPEIFSLLEQYKADTELSSEEDNEVIENEKAIEVSIGPQPEPNKEKYAKSSLSTEAAKSLADQLLHFMQLTQPFLDNELNLPQLALQLGVSPNHLSQVINEQLSLNFYDFVNSYRIEAAKHQLIETAPEKYTILGLALDSGFNSKSAFYAGFKKHTGMTPTQFRKTRNS